jgi:hypothetical protein
MPMDSEQENFASSDPDAEILALVARHQKLSVDLNDTCDKLALVDVGFFAFCKYVGGWEKSREQIFQFEKECGRSALIDEQDARIDEMTAIVRKVLAIQAQTFEGLRAQVRLMAIEAEAIWKLKKEDDLDWDSEVVGMFIKSVLGQPEVRP